MTKANKGKKAPARKSPAKKRGAPRKGMKGKEAGGLLPLHLPEEAGRLPALPVSDPPRDLVSTLYTAAIVAFGICLAKLYLDQYLEIRHLRSVRAQAERQMLSVKDQHDALAEEVEYLETVEGVERLARDKLRYIRPDEVILVPLRP